MLPISIGAWASPKYQTRLKKCSSLFVLSISGADKKKFYNVCPQVDLSSLIEGGVDDDDVIVDTDADADADADAERPKKSSAMVFPELDTSASSRRPSRYEFYQTLVRENSSTTNSSTGQLVDCQLVDRLV